MQPEVRQRLGPLGNLAEDRGIGQRMAVDLSRQPGRHLPGGHIFHGDLAWPWAADPSDLSTPAGRWGVATGRENILLCGSGARRGGAVSGLGGQNAAAAVLELA